MCIHQINKRMSQLDPHSLIKEDDTFLEICDYIDYENLTSLIAPSSNLNIIQLNVRGLINKQSLIDRLLNDSLRKCRVHVVILSETWLNDMNESLINIPNYTYCGRIREHKKGGGVGFLVLNTLIYREFETAGNFATFEHFGIELKCRNKNIKVISMYRPPNTSPKSFVKEYKNYVNMQLSDNSVEHIIGLDHNLDFLKANSHLDTNDFI